MTNEDTKKEKLLKKIKLRNPIKQIYGRRAKLYKWQAARIAGYDQAIADLEKLKEKIKNL